MTSAAVPGAGLGKGAGRGSLRFAQISDLHVFDAGYKCSGSFVQREYEENLAALRWSIDEINRRYRAGDKVDFVVFTGDLGIANLEGGDPHPSSPDSSSTCSGEPASIVGPIPSMDFPTAEATLANILAFLPPDIPIYFVPGNNDLTSEDPKSIDRYTRFIGGLRALMHGRVNDLTGTHFDAKGYTLVGLNSSGFKPQSVKDGNNTDEITLPGKSIVLSTGTDHYCEDLPVEGSVRAPAKAEAMDSAVSQITGRGPYLLLFTHEPDLQDPYRKFSSNDPDTRCEFASTWLLPQKARKSWDSQVLDNPAVLGIFAAHFHDPDPLRYGGPFWSAGVQAMFHLVTGKESTRPGGLAPTFVAPPAAIKLQWKAEPYSTRGMMFVTVIDRQISAQVDFYSSGKGSDCCDATRSPVARAVKQWLKTNPRGTEVLALAFTLLLVLSILLLAGQLDPKCNSLQPQASRWLMRRWACIKYTAAKLIIDRETQTYSLSKSQFLLWTLASIYAYCYLWLAHTLVQGLPGIPDISDQFPGALAWSAGTTVVSQASQRLIGSKGGGPLGPQLSDLISAGGTVAPGRLQFFCWTLVAVGAYLFSVLGTDPTIVQTLPSIPQNLLLVSGLSSIAYVATRAVSSPGPVISSVKYTAPAQQQTVQQASAGQARKDPAVAQDANQAAASTQDANGAPQTAADSKQTAAASSNAPSNGTLTLNGSGLSKRAVITLLEHKDGPQTDVAVSKANTGKSGPGTAASGQPVESATTDDASTRSDVTVSSAPYAPPASYKAPTDSDFLDMLEVKLLQGFSPTRCYKIRITNPDGKFAEGEYPS